MSRESGRALGAAFLTGVLVGGVGLAYTMRAELARLGSELSRSLGEGADDEKGRPPRGPGDDVSPAVHYDSPERISYLRPDVIIRDILKPLLVRVEGRAPVIADVGAGSGFFTLRLVSALKGISPRGARIIATDTSETMRELLIERIASASETAAATPGDGAVPTAFVIPAGSTRPDLPLPADVLLLCQVYHHLDYAHREAVGQSLGSGHSHGGHSHSGGGHVEVIQPTDGAGRIAWLKAAVKEGDVVPGACAVVIEFNCSVTTGIPAPPPQFRLNRSTIVAEFAAAGWSLVSAPDLLAWHHVLVFSAPG